MILWLKRIDARALLFKLSTRGNFGWRRFRMASFGRGCHYWVAMIARRAKYLGQLEVLLCALIGDGKFLLALDLLDGEERTTRSCREYAEEVGLACLHGLAAGRVSEGGIRRPADAAQDRLARAAFFAALKSIARLAEWRRKPPTAGIQPKTGEQLSLWHLPLITANHQGEDQGACFLREPRAHEAL
jgi:hypothetical protein